MPGKFVLLTFSTVYADYLEVLWSGIQAVAWQNTRTNTEEKANIFVSCMPELQLFYCNWFNCTNTSFSN